MVSFLDESNRCIRSDVYDIEGGFEQVDRTLDAGHIDCMGCRNRVGKVGSRSSWAVAVLGADGIHLGVMLLHECGVKVVLFSRLAISHV